MKNIVLAGNPNVGKSVVFSRLTGVNVVSSNYPGTTVDYSRGRTRLGDEVFEIIDSPGIYSLEPDNKAEEISVELIKKADLIINVVDATNLERNLYLSLELAGTGKPMVLVLNMWDETKHLGITIDPAELRKHLKMSVVPIVALTGEGIKELLTGISEARAQSRVQYQSDETKWAAIGNIVKTVQKITHRHHSFKDILVDLTIKPSTGYFSAVIILAAAFMAVRIIGESLIRFILDPMFELYKPIIRQLSGAIGIEWLRTLLIGSLVNNDIDFGQSMGLLTTGIYVPFGMVLPYVAAFYLMLGILEDSGYLPRLATLSDTFFHRLGMHGQGILSVLLGLGCKVPGMLATRTLETGKQRFICATLLSIAVPCMSQTAMVFGVLGKFGARYPLIVFVTLALTYISAGILMNRIIKGECAEIFLEIPPYRWPGINTTLKKTWMRIRGFLTEAVPFLFLGIFLIGILHAAGVLVYIAKLTAGITEFWFKLPGDATIALVTGFLRKDLAIGMLVPLNLSPEQMVVAVTVLTVSFPCAATFAVLVKELGIINTGKAFLIMIAAAFIVGGLLRLILM